MGLIYSGTDLAGDLVVEDWRTHGMRFVPPKGARKRKAALPVMIVLHWTGSENAPEQVYKTLVARDLGVHLITGHGRIVQCADLSLVTYHAGVANDRSIGIENVNKGMPPSGKVTRPLSPSVIHGTKKNTLNFLDDEIAQIAKLVTTLCGYFEIPMVIPGRGSEPYDKVLSRFELSKFCGVIGHYQISDEKTDPGSDLLRQLVISYGFRMALP